MTFSFTNSIFTWNNIMFCSSQIRKQAKKFRKQSEIAMYGYKMGHTSILQDSNNTQKYHV